MKLFTVKVSFTISGFLSLLEIRENWKPFFQSGKSRGIWQFFKKSGENQGILITQYFFYILCLFMCIRVLSIKMYFWDNLGFTIRIPLFLNTE